MSESEQTPPPSAPHSDESEHPPEEATPITGPKIKFAAQHPAATGDNTVEHLGEEKVEPLDEDTAQHLGEEKVEPLDEDTAQHLADDKVEPLGEVKVEPLDGELTHEEGEASARNGEAALSSEDALQPDELPPPPEATEDHPEDIPPDPGSADAASPRMQSIVESLLFASDKPLSLKQLGELTGETELARVRAAIAAVEQLHTSRGFQLHQVAGGYQFRTNPENAQWVQKLLAQKPVRLTRAQLETLAICAYRQPITRPEIDEIRGVDSGGTLKTLMERALVRILGKKEEPGRPMLYGTTREFLEFFNLSDLKDLPTLREFHELSEEHQAQVAALEGVAPAGSIEAREGEGVEAPTDAPTLRRLEITTPPEDEAELEEIDRLIRTAGVVTDQDQPVDGATHGEGEGETTREFDHEDVARTQLHHRTIPTPHVDDVDGEFDRSETTSKKPRPEAVATAKDDDDDDDDDDDAPESDGGVEQGPA
jgi:segregation and condensation protein B